MEASFLPFEREKLGNFPIALKTKGWVELLPKKGERRQSQETICKSIISIILIYISDKRFWKSPLVKSREITVYIFIPYSTHLNSNKDMVADLVLCNNKLVSSIQYWLVYDYRFTFLVLYMTKLIIKVSLQSYSTTHLLMIVTHNKGLFLKRFHSLSFGSCILTLCS